ncbi:hypothetical protein XOC_2916 [Xanthomonas oryzae pv. oryzicola BLS256]|uniref:Uncharacterized protein n=1 Tax=Xanthomonas oryzae pv. oryzicola (strain BLS256) TaxID=383407 RepID=G7TK84_XANOB|nr:hypothetical protein XOC_2916 [Xanthomonas oryzae pv. oryzicola BLS256]QEO96869.1 hypothetical protein XOCgx_1877 [Xanthomonas oryzae pv. oryzicola]
MLAVLEGFGDFCHGGFSLGVTVCVGPSSTHAENGRPGGSGPRLRVAKNGVRLTKTKPRRIAAPRR